MQAVSGKRHLTLPLGEGFMFIASYRASGNVTMRLSWLVIGITLLAGCSTGATDVRSLVTRGAIAMDSNDLRTLFGEERLFDYQSPNGCQWGTVRFRTNDTIALQWHSWWGGEGTTEGTWLISGDRICYTWPEWPALSDCTHWYRTTEGKFAEASRSGRILYNVTIK